MDDLISRKALLAAMIKRTEMNAYSQYDTYNYLVSAEIVANAEAVPAVPLDKLCEWLAKYGYPCAIIDTEQCTLQECDVGIDFSQEQARNCWKMILTKWMEESNRDAE